jgi:hypothetical protein
MLLSQLLQREGYRAESIPIGMTEEMLTNVVDMNPEVVCISALPPFAFNDARALYIRLRARLPKLHIAICVWHYEGDPTKGAARLKMIAGHAVFTTLGQAVQHINFRLHDTVIATPQS